MMTLLPSHCSGLHCLSRPTRQRRYRGADVFGGFGDFDFDFDFADWDNVVFDSLTPVRVRPTARVVYNKPLHNSGSSLMRSAFPFMGLEQSMREVDTTFGVDCKENADGVLEITANLPGFEKKDVCLEVKDQTLILSAHKTRETTHNHSPALESTPAPAVIKDDDSHMVQTTSLQTPSQPPASPQTEKEETGSMLDRLRAASKENESIFEEQQSEFVPDAKQDISTDNQDPSASDQQQRENATQRSILSTAPRVWHQERSSFSGSRCIRLPADFDEAAITASLENGVLKVLVPRIPTAKPTKRNITIQ